MTEKVKVGFVQLNSSFSGQHYLPLSVGMLQAYAQMHLKHPDAYEFARPIYRFMKIEEASEFLSGCDIVGVSCYVWNDQNSLAIARDYKRRNPNGVVVFGGPQVPDSQKQFRRARTVELTADEKARERMHFTADFHKAYPFIDMACHGEGERVFTAILEQMTVDRCRDKSAIRSVSYVDAVGAFHYNPKLGRMTDNELALVSSPLTSGVFDALMAEHPDEKWILMYETDRGCPYMCSYCDWGGATEDRVSKFRMEQIYTDIMWLGQHRIPYVFLCNANFGLLARDVQIAEFFAEAKARFGYLEGVSTQNAKNPKKHTLQALKVLERAGLNKATVMSQQSLNRATLKAVRRDNMKLDQYYEIQKQLAAEGVYTMTDLILPMPEETYDSLADAISTLISRGQHNRIQFNNLSILRNTEMGNPEYQRQYGMQIVKAKIINGHGTKNDSIGGIEEWQELVVATNTMPPAEWRKARAFCWMVNLVYFNKLLHIPSIVFHEAYGVSYRHVFEFICQSRTNQHPILAEINAFFEHIAQGIQDGNQEEYVHSPQWLDIYWPPEEYAFIKLCVEGKLTAFYEEARDVLSQALHQAGAAVPDDVLQESLRLNHLLIKVPFQTEDAYVTLSYNISDFVHKIMRGQPATLEKGAPHTLVVDRTSERWSTWDDWYQKMVWYGNRRGAYLYGTEGAGTEIAGHH
jgi:radical SAM superfamily enzyme YgiQ (UPF0313 family)